MSTIKRILSSYMLPEECREQFIREDRLFNNRAGFWMGLVLSGLFCISLLMAAIGELRDEGSTLASQPWLPVLLVEILLAVLLCAASLVLRARGKADSKLSTYIPLVLSCLQLVTTLYQAWSEIPRTGIININLVILSMFATSLLLRFPLHVVLAVESATFALTMWVLVTHAEVIANFRASLIDLLAAFLLIMVTSVIFWYFRLHSFLGTRRLRTLVTQDSLTGIQNRRSFDETLEQLWHQARAEGKPVSLLMADVDFFKLYNDTYGHQQGDACLQGVAQAMGASVRGSDFVGRYGGEEFVVLLPASGRDAAQRVAERIFREMEHMNIPHAGSSVAGYVTLSIGCACIDPAKTSLTPGAFVHMADEALYRAKQEGRNRLVVHPDSVPAKAKPGPAQQGFALP